jgi:hypothetical protein
MTDWLDGSAGRQLSFNNRLSNCYPDGTGIVIESRLELQAFIERMRGCIAKRHPENVEAGALSDLARSAPDFERNMLVGLVATFSCRAVVVKRLSRDANARRLVYEVNGLERFCVSGPGVGGMNFVVAPKRPDGWSIDFVTNRREHGRVEALPGTSKP